MNRTDRAWFAGLLEGEGSITIAAIHRGNQKRGYALHVQVGMTDEEIVRHLRELAGCGSVVVRRLQPPRRTAFLWDASAVKAATLLAELYPFFRSSRVRAKAELALAFQRQKRIGAARHIEGYRDEQERFFREMRVLNERGVSNRRLP